MRGEPHLEWCIVVSVALAAACAHESKPGPMFPFVLPPAMKADTSVAANYSCVGTPDPLTGGPDVSWDFTVIDAPAPGDPPDPSASAVVQQFDPTTGTLVGSPLASPMTVPSNSRISLRLEPPDVDHHTTDLLDLVTPATQPTSPVSLPVVSMSFYASLDPTLGSCEFARGVSRMTIVDCDGDPVRNAFVRTTLEGSEPGIALTPMVNGYPDANTIATQATGEVAHLDCWSDIGTASERTQEPLEVYIYDGPDSEGDPSRLVSAMTPTFDRETATIFELRPLRVTP